jgi:hypothetical protein
MMNPTDDFFPEDLAAMVDAELAKGEKVAWIGRPIPWLRARSSLPMALVGIPFTAFALFWIAAAGGFVFHHGGPGPPGFFPLFGIPLVLVGLGLLLSPLWAYRKAMRTVYAITDQRALTIEPGLWGHVVVQSFEPQQLAHLERHQRGDGSGDLVFRREHRGSGRGHYMVAIGFLAVADVREAEDRIRQLVARAAASRGDRG